MLQYLIKLGKETSSHFFFLSNRILSAAVGFLFFAVSSLTSVLRSGSIGL